MDCEDRRPLWQEVLLIAVPILVAEGCIAIREHLRRRGKKHKKKKREALDP